ncbi:MAG: hypothetical protein V1905_04170 [bacterium]
MAKKPEKIENLNRLFETVDSCIADASRENREVDLSIFNSLQSRLANAVENAKRFKDELEKQGKTSKEVEAAFCNRVAKVEVAHRIGDSGGVVLRENGYVLGNFDSKETLEISEWKRRMEESVSKETVLNNFFPDKGIGFLRAIGAMGQQEIYRDLINKLQRKRSEEVRWYAKDKRREVEYSDPSLALIDGATNAIGDFEFEMPTLIPGLRVRVKIEETGRRENVIKLIISPELL